MTPTDKLVLILDSTQINAWLSCPQMWKYSYHENLTPFIGEPKDSMMKGTYGHKLFERYYKSRAAGGSIQEATANAESFNPDDSTCANCKHDKHNGACNDITCACSNYQPRPFELSMEHRQTVLNKFRDYTYTYSALDFEPASADHVEVGFSHKLYESPSRLYILEGRIDAIGTLQGLRTVVDHKFQDRMKSLYKKSVQFRNYCLVSGINMLIINYVRLTKGTTKDTFVRDIVSFNPIEMEHWRQRLIMIYDEIAVAYQNQHFEKRESACMGQYGSVCPFTPLCEEWQNDLVQLKKQQLYVRKEDWRPW